MNKIPLAYDSILLNYANHRKYLEWMPELHPHLLVLGNTGSGKSYFIKLLLGNIAKKESKARAICCCYKNALLPPSTPNFYGYTSVTEGFEKAESIFLERLESNTSNCKFDTYIVVIDEYVGWLASMEDRDSKAIKKRVARLLTMSRSVSMNIILGATRGMAEDFSHGSRDCLNVIFLGSASKESIRSFCSAEHASIIEPRGRGEGYAVFDGQPPAALTVPTVKSEKALNEAILKLLSYE